MPEVTVIIPTYNRRDLLEQVIMALKEQIFKDFEVIIIDDSPNFDTAMAACDWALDKLTYVKRPDLGFRVSSARKLAIEYADSRILVGIQDATLPSPELIDRHVKRIGKRRIFSIGSVREIPGDPDSDYREAEGFFDNGHPLWNYAWGKNFALPTADAKNVQFDIDYDGAFGWEDIDFGLRCTLAGLRLMWNKKAYCTQLPRIPNKGTSESLQEQYKKFRHKTRAVPGPQVGKRHGVMRNV